MRSAVSLRWSISPSARFAVRRPTATALPDPAGGSGHQCNSSGVGFVRRGVCLSIDYS
jgi:hypothetical protein